MPLLDQIPSRIANVDDIKAYVEAYKKSQQDRDEVVSPVYQAILAEYTRLLVNNLDICFNNPPSPTIADGRQDHAPAPWAEFTYETLYKTEGATKPIRHDPNRPYNSATRCTRMKGYLKILPRVERLERLVLTLLAKERFRRMKGSHVDKRLWRRKNRQLKSEKVRPIRKEKTKRKLGKL